jgi:membrane protein YqaA with SNARE-associated domain
MKLLRKLYDWVLSWANSPYGSLALAIIAFAESSFFPIPPDALLIALALGNRKKSFYYAFICGIFSVVGGFFGYAIGYYAWWNLDGSFSSLAYFFFNNIPGFNQASFYKVKALYDEYNFFIIFTAGFTPIPYKIFTISAGAFAINAFLFGLASIIGRAARFFLVAFLLWKFGESIKAFIDKYFDLLAVAFTVLLIGGFIAVKYVF